MNLKVSIHTVQKVEMLHQVLLSCPCHVSNHTQEWQFQKHSYKNSNQIIKLMVTYRVQKGLKDFYRLKIYNQEVNKNKLTYLT